MPAACRSKSGTMRTTASSLASACILSVVGPGMDSARSNRSLCCALQKYGALKSSFRQMIWAPRAAASRIRRSARATVAAASASAWSWMSPMVNGVELESATPVIIRWGLTLV